ncbi:ATP-binding protein [Streptomyces sp. NPDC002851]
MQFTSTPKNVALVRKHVAKALIGWGYHSDDIDTAVLICSELAANAVQHGHRRGHLFAVRITADGSHCLIEVCDPSPRIPHWGEASADDEHGRGLQLVATLAEETGHHPRRHLGKTVWARLQLTTPKTEGRSGD